MKPGQLLDEAAFQQALAAVRLVDRYRSVEGTLGADGSAIVNLDPLTPVATWRWEGDAVPKSFRKSLLLELRKGQRLGPQRRAVLTGNAEHSWSETIQMLRQSFGRWCAGGISNAGVLSSQTGT